MGIQRVNAPVSSSKPASPAVASTGANASRAALGSAKPLVFVVDDDESVRRSISALLSSVGMDVMSFGSAQEFLAFKRPDRPSCLICDVRLPGQSGLDIQASLGAKDSEMAIIFITGYGTVQLGVRAMRAGALDFLEKPFEEQDLLDAVFKALQSQQERRARRDERMAIESRLATLTQREREVLLLVVSGLPNKKIAAQLGTSEKTVKVHRGRVMEKMLADSLAQLVHMIDQAGLISPT